MLVNARRPKEVFSVSKNTIKGTYCPAIKEGAMSGINRYDLYSYTNLSNCYIILKDPGPLRSKKTIFGGLTAYLGAYLDHVASGVNIP